MRPSGVTAGAERPASSFNSSRCRRCRRVFAASSSIRVGSRMMTPVRPSSSSIWPSRTRCSAPDTPITAGMPSECARMAAWEVRVPSSLTSPTTCSRSSWTVRPGESSCATTMTCSSRAPDQGSRSEPPISFSTTRRWMAVRSVSRSRSCALPELRPQVAELEGLEFVGRLGAQLVLPDQRLDAGQEVGVLHHQDLGLEDPGFLDAGALEHALAERLEPLDGFLHGGMQAAHLAVDLRFLDRAVGDFRESPMHHHRRGKADARRDADALKEPVGAHDSPKPSATRRGQRVERGLRVRPFGAERDGAAALGGQHHDAHNALPVDREAILRRSRCATGS